MRSGRLWIFVLAAGLLAAGALWAGSAADKIALDRQVWLQEHPEAADLYTPEEDTQAHFAPRVSPLRAEPSAEAAPPGPKAVLWDNGPLVTHPGGGAGGADASALQTALGMGSYGSGHQFALGYHIADDFTVTGSWTIDTITFFAYQTNSTTASTFTGVYLAIWDGVPAAPGSSIVWGDYVSNVMSATAWSGIYRVLDTALTNTARPIMANTVAVGTTLPAGTYWLDWMSDGTLSSGPWASPVSILGSTGTGNALQSLDGGATWAAVTDVGPQDYPFIIEGAAGVNAGNPVLEDFCPEGGPGDQDGIYDPGETFDFHLDVENTFGGDLTDLTATCAITQGIGVLYTDTVYIGTLANGAVATVMFDGLFGIGNCCGDTFELSVTVTANELASPAGPFAFAYLIGDYTPPLPQVLLFEEFEGFDGSAFPGWTIVDNGGDCSWADNVFYGGANLAGGAGNCASADADACGSGTTMDTELRSPAFNLSGPSYVAAELNFIAAYNYLSGDFFDVDLTTDGGMTWTNLLHWVEDHSPNGPGEAVSVDLTPWLGEPALQVRFHYVSPGWNWWADVDDVEVVAYVEQPCLVNPCADANFSSWVLQTTDFQSFYKWETVCIDMTDETYASWVDFYVDGIYIGTDWAHPFCVTFDASAWPVGPHEFYAVVNACEISWMTNVVTFYTVGSLYALPKADPPTGIAELTTQFTANAQWGAGAYTYLWWFGDGTPPSTEANPEHTFMDPGDYLVTLQIWDGLGERYICAPYKVTVVELPLPFLEPDFVVANPLTTF